MALEMKVYNNLTRSKVPFKTVEEGKVRFYSCGPTTYDFLHVGNARALVVGDLFHRVLKCLGYEVNFVRNYTDVDDKIIERAVSRGVSALEHSAEFVRECQTDMNALGMLPATFTPKVSDTMPEIIQMIQKLIEKNFAYEVAGEVYYEVPKFEHYGKLSKKKLEDLEMGKRVEVDEKKKNPSDFVLWKPAKEGEPSWESPWGKGRPGWHIECSAMSKKFLGHTIDLHHGGVDLIFPHHENEIAQSEAANGCEFSRHWCHNEFLNFGKEKMSKSLGNVITIRDFCQKFSGEVLRQILCSTHYRSKMEWNEDVIERAITDLDRIHKFIISYEHAKKNNSVQSLIEEPFLKDLHENILEDLANDFSIPSALGRFFSMIRDMNREYLDENGIYLNKKKLSTSIMQKVDALIALIKESTGLIFDDAQAILNKLQLARKNLSNNDQDQRVTDQEVEELIRQRKEARTLKDWAKADQIRDRFNELGIVLKDNPDGTTTWSYK